MNSSMSDQISNESDEDQQRFYEYTQRSLRRRWAEVEAKTEQEIDFERRTKCQT